MPQGREDWIVNILKAFPFQIEDRGKKVVATTSNFKCSIRLYFSHGRHTDFVSQAEHALTPLEGWSHEET